ncbi:MAG: hypothetical protein K2N87_17170 [Eubacterium sp.]|nr:hypothetical protein [Eubacterium sp.]
MELPAVAANGLLAVSKKLLRSFYFKYALILFDEAARIQPYFGKAKKL